MTAARSNLTGDRKCDTMYSDQIRVRGNGTDSFLPTSNLNLNNSIFLAAKAASVATGVLRWSHTLIWSLGCSDRCGFCCFW